MSAHTPGPWHIENEPFNVWDSKGLLVARANAPLDLTDSEWDAGCANARLIAAAPDLLEAAKGLLSLNGLDWQITTGWKALRAAIDKAEGK